MMSDHGEGWLTRRSALFAVALLLASAQVSRAWAGDPGPTLVVHAGTLLIDARRPVMNRATLVIQGERLVEIRAGHVPAEAIARGAQLIDFSTRFVLPGLIDTQTHLIGQLGDGRRIERDVVMSDADIALRGALYAGRTLLAGFTTIRDMGSAGEAMFALRDAIEAGRVIGPRMQVAGRIIGPELGGQRLRTAVDAVVPVNSSCSGADDCRRAVREEYRRGADTIKLYMNADLAPGTEPFFSDAELRAMVDTAHGLGLKVTGSAFGNRPIQAALRAGADAVVHAVFLDDESIALARRSSAYLIPTLNAAETVRELALDPAASVSAEWRAENLEIHRAMFAGFSRAVTAGAKIAFGTDAGWRPHGQNAGQFRLMVEAGMSPQQSLVSATVDAAAAMGLADEVGSLEPGKYADLIAVDGDPLLDVTELTRVVFVMKAGRIYKRP